MATYVLNPYSSESETARNLQIVEAKAYCQCRAAQYVRWGDWERATRWDVAADRLTRALGYPTR